MGEWFHTDEVDTDGPFDTDPLTVGQQIPEITFDDLQIQDTINDLVCAEMRREEYAIRGAIRAGYDGVDINRPPLSTSFDAVGIVSIEPWHCPEPDSSNGNRTTRYTWHWFSDDELTELLRVDNALELLEQ